MKTINLFLLMAGCAIAMSSCSVVRGYVADGKGGPDIFSYEERELDTIANGGTAFRFPEAQKRACWIDTLYFYNEAHRCARMTVGEAGSTMWRTVSAASRRT